MASKKSSSGSLARVFTRRNKNVTSDAEPNRNMSIRSKFSGPVELIHTTNMLSYNAPDIKNTTISPKSDGDSDSTAPATASSTVSSPPTSPDVDNSTEGKPSPQPNHLSCYFAPPSDSILAPAKASPAPIIPSRAASHTKKNSEMLSSKRSITRFSNHSATSKGSSSTSRASSTSISTSHSSMLSTHAPPKLPALSFTTPPMPPPQHALPLRPSRQRSETTSENPFGHELAKVTELAEEFGVKDKMLPSEGDDEIFMREKGLRKHAAKDYISDIQSLISELLEDMKPVRAPLWI